jgi:hypothetical protein
MSNLVTRSLKAKGNTSALLGFWKSELMNDPGSRINLKQVKSTFSQYLNLDAAIEFMETIVLTHLNEHKLPTQLARAYKERGDINSAIQFWQRAVSQEPSVPYPLIECFKTQKEDLMMSNYYRGVRPVDRAN